MSDMHSQESLHNGSVVVADTGAVTRVSEVLEGGKKWMKVTFRGEDELK